MSRVIISLIVALTLIFGTLFIKHQVSASNNPKAALIATEINTLNAPSIAAYAQQLNASATEDTSTTTAYPSISNASSTPETPLNATQQLSQNLFTQYESLKQSGADVSDPNVAQQLASNLLSQPYVTGTSTVYTQENLTVNTYVTKQSLINYGNALGTALSTPLPAGAQVEVYTFQTFAQTNDTSVLAQLSANITRYKQIERKLLSMSVPELFVSDHLAIINTISEVIHDIGVIQTSDTDPLGAETALSDYPNAITNLSNALGDEKNIFLDNNISFSPSDAGYVLTK